MSIYLKNEKNLTKNFYRFFTVYKFIRFCFSILFRLGISEFVTVSFSDHFDDTSSMLYFFLELLKHISLDY